VTSKPRYVIFLANKIISIVGICTQISKLIVSDLHGIGVLLSIEIAVSRSDTVMRFSTFPSYIRY